MLRAAHTFLGSAGNPGGKSDCGVHASVRSGKGGIETRFKRVESQTTEVGDFLRYDMVDPDGSGGVGIRQPQGDLHDVPGGPEARSLGRRHELDQP